MTEITELQRRIAQALQRVRVGIEGLETDAAPADATALSGEDAKALTEKTRAFEEEVVALREALDQEKTIQTRLQAQLDAMMLKSGSATEALETKIASLTAEMDALETENKSLRASVADLQGVNAGLRDTAAEGISDPDLINQSLAADLRALQVSRAAEIRDMDAILTDLKPILEESANA